MSSALSSELRRRFRAYIEEGLCGRAAVARLKLSAATVAHLQRKWATVAADNFKRATAARPHNPSSIKARNRVRSSDDSADDMKHPPNRDESQIKPNGNPTIQASRSPLSPGDTQRDERRRSPTSQIWLPPDQRDTATQRDDHETREAVSPLHGREARCQTMTGPQTCAWLSDTDAKSAETW